MPNGYDTLYSEIKYVYHFLDYCEALVNAEEKLFSRIGDLRVISKLRPRMLTMLEETEAISKYIEEKIYPDIKSGILEHNESMGEVFRVHLPEAIRNAGYTDAEAKEHAKNSIERTRIDFKPIETRFGSIIDNVSLLKERIRNYTDKT